MKRTISLLLLTLLVMFGVSAYASPITSQHAEASVASSEQQYTVSVSVVGESFLDYGSFSVVFYDENNNAIQSDEPNTITCDEGCDINIALEGPIGSYYMKEIVVNGTSLGVNEESNYQYPLDFGYSIENLSGNMEIVFKPELFIRYKTVYCSANGPGVVKMYKNGTYVGTTTDNGSGNNVVSVVIDHSAQDEIMLEFIPDEGCQFSELHRGFYDADLEQEGSEITNAVNNNAYAIKYQTDEYSYSRMFAATFETVTTPPVQHYNISVSKVDAYNDPIEDESLSVVFYDKDNNVIQSDDSHTITCEEGSYIKIELEEGNGDYPFYYITHNYVSDLIVNGTSLGPYEEQNSRLSYVIDNLSGNVDVVFKLQLIEKYRTVYCEAKGPGSVKMYKNGTYVGTTTDNGHGFQIVSVVIDPIGNDEIKLEFIPEEGCRLSRLGSCFETDVDGNEVSVENNMFTIKYVNDTYAFYRSFMALFERVETSVILNETNFPDATFRAYISNLTGVAEGETISEEKLLSVKSIDVSGSNDAIGSITDLKGIEYFTALQQLSCGYNQLTSLDVSNNTALTNLYSDHNQLTSLDVSNNIALTILYCFDNQLTSLDVYGNTALTTLYCSNNPLTSLDVSYNTALKWLECYNNQLTSLDVSNNTALTRLYCYNNPLTSLDVSHNTALTELLCGNNQFTNLDVSHNTELRRLVCWNDQLTNLDVSNNTALTELICANNQLSSLDVSNNKALIKFWCYDNLLTSLDFSHNTALTELRCYNNPLTSLNVSNNSALTTLYCQDNLLTSLDLSVNTALNSVNIKPQSVFLEASTRGSSRYSIEVSSDFDILKVSAFTVDGVSTTPSLIDGTLAFTATSTPQTITYQYDSGNSVAGLMDVRVNITSIEGGNGVFLDETNFPDATFRSYISNLTGVEEGGTLSEEKLQSVKTINVSIKGITSLKGIEFFTTLTQLWCDNNQLTNLEVANNTALEYLYCYNNQLTSLDVSNNMALRQLWCSNNQLTSLDVSHNTALTKLNCSLNQLTSLDVSNNTALTWLSCDNNQLTSLDVSNNTVLTHLDCNNNPLTSLDVSNNTALTWLTCYGNQLTSLDVSNNTALTVLYCSGNPLKSLDVSNNTALTSLSCYGNQLTSLDVSINTALTDLNCDNNQLTSLDVSKNTALIQLFCSSNQLTSLDVSSNTKLTHLSCNNNQLTNLDLSMCSELGSSNAFVWISPQSTSMSVTSTGSNMYCTSIPSDFDISEVSAFTVDGVITTPSFNNGTIVFTASSTPQVITYQYDSGNSVAGLMDVTVNITSVEEPNYDNTIYMDNVEVLSGTEAVLSVKMKNTVVAEGFEFNLYLPEGVTVVTDEDGFPDVTLSTERTTSRKTNSFDAVLREDGSLRVLGASTNGSAISGNDGEVVQMKVAIADDMAEGDYTVCFKNIAISDENAESHTSAMTTSTIKVNTYIVGDANIDRKVDVADFTAVAHHLLNNTPQSFHQKAADANTDNRIDVGDLTAIAHLILYGTITKPTNASGAKPFMMMDNGTPTDENYIYIEPVSVQGQSEVTLSVKMRNAVEAEGFEFDLYLPDGMSFVTDADGFAEVSLSTERTNSRKTNSFDSVIQEDGSLRVLAASTNGSSISGNDGEVALVTIHIDPNLAAAEYPLLLKNIAIADVNAVSHSTDLKESMIIIPNNGITTDLEKVQSSKFNVQSDEWYSLDGKKLNSKPKAKGVYIMNEKKVRVK